MREFKFLFYIWIGLAIGNVIFAFMNESLRSDTGCILFFQFIALFAAWGVLKINGIRFTKRERDYD